jgi:hypothetical protein
MISNLVQQANAVVRLSRRLANPLFEDEDEIKN